jgi:hypothetical protein
MDAPLEHPVDIPGAHFDLVPNNYDEPPNQLFNYDS